MCGIYGEYGLAPDPNRIKEAMNNISFRNRGSKRYTLTLLEKRGNSTIEATFPSFEEMVEFVDKDPLVKRPLLGFVFHVQSPTAMDAYNVDLFEQRQHPAEYQGLHVWHNGMMDEKALRGVTKDRGLDKAIWDTELLAEHLYDVVANGSLSGLDNFPGSFALIGVTPDNHLWITRNKISPMFLGEDKEGTYRFCSVKLFPFMEPLPPGHVWNEGKIVYEHDNQYNPFGL
jgi:glutamine phosphoribosylpyrophosphate amidotransferase